MATLLAAAGLLAAGMVAERQSRAALSAELRSRLLLRARSLARVGAEALRSDYPELMLHPLIRELQREDPALILAAVVDRLGIIQGHSDARRLGEPYAAPEAVMPLTDVGALRPGELLAAGTTLLLAESPVLDPGGESMGRAVAGVRRSEAAAGLREARQTLLLLGGIACLAVMLLLARYRAERRRNAPGTPAERTAVSASPAPTGSGSRAPAASTQAAREMTHDRVEGALACLARAEREGRYLRLPADFAGLVVLHDWMHGLAELRDLSLVDQGLVLTAIYESAASLAERACGLDSGQRIDLWWVAAPTPESTGLAGGFFLLRDRGRSLVPDARGIASLGHPAQGQRWRGLKAISGASGCCEYFPATTAGNLTLLTFGRRQCALVEEPLHA